MQVEITSRELATVLAALRAWQEENAETAGPNASYAEFFQYHAPLTILELDELCQKFNTGHESSQDFVTSSDNRRCPDCGVLPTTIHRPGCDVEACPKCGHQLISCGCDTETLAAEDLVPWTGEWPGTAECEEFGWWAVFNTAGPGWVAVPLGTEEATHDLNRLYTDAVWDKTHKRWRLPGQVLSTRERKTVRPERPTECKEP
jgi:hypothetical protein